MGKFIDKIKSKRYTISLFITVLGLLGLISGTSYAILKGRTISTNEQIIKAGSVELRLTENFNNIDEGVSTMKDVDGLLQETVYEFTVSNIGSVAAKYDLKLLNEAPSGQTALSDEYIRLGLEVNGKEMGPMGLSKVNNIIDSNTINEGELIRYKLRLWFDKNKLSELTSNSKKAYLKLKIDAKQAEYIEKEKILVSLDADGGTIPSGQDWTGSGATVIKRIASGSTYGNLPVPTKTGYTFKGWNGKNLIKIDNHNVSFENAYYKDNIPTPKYELNASTDYTLSFNYKVNNASNGIYASVGYGSTSFQRDIKSSNAYSDTGRLVLTFTTPASFDYNPSYVAFRLVRMSSTGTADVDISNVQLESGSTATNYEPYYVTENTKMEQTTNHTLKAVWEANS